MAIAVCGLVGSVAFNPNTEYLEDDGLYSKTSLQLISGWEWGLSNANASDGDIEVICCGWNPGGWGDGWSGGGGGGGGGGDASQPDDPNDYGDGDAERRRNLRRCLNDASTDKSDCYSFATNSAGLAAIGCTLAFASPVGAALCATLGLALSNYNTGVCDDIFVESRQDCENKYG